MPSLVLAVNGIGDGVGRPVLQELELGYREEEDTEVI